MPKYYENTCKYVFKNGNKKGDVCGKICALEYCKVHNNKTLARKKNYYYNNKMITEDPYEYLINRAKKNIKNGNNISKNSYIEKKALTESKLTILKQQKYGILLFLGEINEDYILNKDLKKMKILIQMLKYITKNINNKKLCDYEVTQEELNNKDIREKALKKYNKNNKYCRNCKEMTIVDTLLSLDDIYYLEKNLSKKSYEKYEGTVEQAKKDLILINEKINHIIKLNNTYLKIIKLFK